MNIDVDNWIEGLVVHGLNNGEKFGFPTANIQLLVPDLLNDKGVFAVKILIQNATYYGMLYVGTRPTLHLSHLSIEIHIFDFNKTIYNQLIKFKVMKKIRDEYTFSSITELIKQLNHDKNEIKQYLYI